MSQKRARHILSVIIATVAAAALHLPPLVGQENSLQEMRASSYGGRPSAPLDSCADGCRTVHFTHWWKGMPTLPGRRSELIVVGETSTCTAQLSTDRTAIYTECTATIQSIQKSRPDARTRVGSTIVLTREGGTLTAGGETMSSFVAAQGELRPNTKYILFLKFRPATEDYSVLTAYEIGPHGLEAVDAPPYFHRFDGMDWSAFLTAVAQSEQDETQFVPGKKTGGEK